MPEALGIYDLLAPQILLGFNFPAEVDEYLKGARVVELHMAHDDEAVVYTGTVSFDVEGSTQAIIRHREPSGANFEWDGARVGFRLTVPRQGAPFIQTGVDELGRLNPAPRDLFATFGAAPEALGSDYPGVRFRLELLIDLLRLTLGSEWMPGKLDPGGSKRVVPDPTQGNRVTLVVPKLALVFEIGQDPAAGLVRMPLMSWGDNGFDAPSDLAMGELIRLDPPIALHSSGRFAIALDTVALDLSPDHTPRQIIEYFGVGDDWQGVYVKHARFMATDDQKGWGFQAGIKDVLISFAGEVSMEAEMVLLGPESEAFGFDIYIYEGERRVDVPLGGSAVMRRDGRIQIHVRGGVPQFRTTVTLAGRELPRDAQGFRIPDDLANGAHRLNIEVQDSTTPTANFQTGTAMIMVGAALGSSTTQSTERVFSAFSSAQQGARLEMTSTIPRGYLVDHVAATSVTIETVRIVAPPNAPAPSVTAGGRVVTVTNSAFAVDVPDGATVPIIITYPAATTSPIPHLLFAFDRPDDARDEAAYIAERPSGDPDFAPSLRAFRDAIVDVGSRGRQVDLIARASTAGDSGPDYNADLSEARLRVALALLPSSAVRNSEAVGFTGATDAPEWQRVEAAVVGSDARDVVMLTANLIRPARDDSGTGTTDRSSSSITRPTPEQPRESNDQPPALRHIGIRFRLERNNLVMGELSIRIDFQTELEGRLRNAPMGDGSTSDIPADQRLSMTDDGVFDFVLHFTYDTATRQLTETISVAAAPNDQDGLAQIRNADGANTLVNIFGGIALLLPVINSVAEDFAPEDGGDWALLAGALAIPAVLGGAGFLRTTKWTWYGIELKSRQHIPEGADARFGEIGVLFDYKVDFQVHIDDLDIHSTRDMSARYKAIGFAFTFDDPTAEHGFAYHPIFDTSKGYTLDIGDPGVFRLPDPLGEILRIFSVAIARFNPLTLDLDLGLKVDLGIVTVDRLKIKWPIEPLDVPTILPTGVSIDIPNALTGRGYLNFDDGFEGTLDISIVPVKVRVAASLAIKTATDPEVPGRSATAVFASLIVEFPSPIVVGATGLGIYGFAGLFAMHYRRTELLERNADEAVSPALKWLQMAEGQPAQLRNSRNEELWEPAIDRWSFGIGIIAGTIEGGTLINLTGTVVLELPGPRLLIFVKIQIISAKPKSTKDVDVTVGILGVLDLDFENGRITIGVIINYEARDLITLRIPVEIFFNLRRGEDWHLDVGTIHYPVEALILNFVRATAFLMIHGDEIRDFPVISGEPVTLPGVAIAMGIEAAIVLGDEGIGIYLKVAAGFHAGIAFSPFFIAGDMYLLGELRLIVIGIEASAEFGVVYPPTFVHGLVHGLVDFGLFRIEATVEFTLGGGEPELTPPALITGMWLQSHAPVLTSGQGGDRPIDASLGAGLPITDGAFPVGPTPGLFGHQLTGTSTAVAAGLLTDDHGGVAEKDMPVDGYKGMLLRTDADGLFYRITANTATELTLEHVSVRVGAEIPTDGDASATPVAGGYTIFLPVPIDSVPVLQLLQSPRLAPDVETFTEPLDMSPRLTPDGWVDVSGERQIRYTVKRVILEPPLPAGTTPPPATWRSERPRQIVKGADDAGRRDQNVDLALFSRELVTAPRALERSQGLNDRVEEQFGDLCVPIAPPACVLWTFCAKPLGPSGHGWRLDGTPQEDPPDTSRSAPPPTRLDVIEAPQEPLDALLDLLRAQRGGRHYVAARIVGPNGPPFTGPLQLRPDVRVPPLTRWIGSRVLLDRKVLTTAKPALAKPRIPPPQIPTPWIVPRVPLPSPRPKPPLPQPRPQAPPQPPSAPSNWRCFRVLQLPYHVRTEKPEQKWPTGEFGLGDELVRAHDDRRWVEFQTGAATRMSLFLGVATPLIGTKHVVVRELDARGSLLRQTAIEDLRRHDVTGTTTGLPAEWLRADGPWTDEVQAVAWYLAQPDWTGVTRMVVSIEPDARTTRIRVALRPIAPVAAGPVIVAALEVCSRSEVNRADTDAAAQASRLRYITLYFQAPSTLPLLARNTAYRLRVEYEAQGHSLDEPERVTTVEAAQEFCFFTDDEPPARLDPYVLGTTPEHEAAHHFVDDPVSVVFNDGAIVELFRKYGNELELVLRPAGGTPGTSLGEGTPLPPFRILELILREGMIGTPFHEALARLSAELPCARTAPVAPRHGTVTADFVLQPLMSYSLDVETVPRPIRDPDDRRPYAPLYRRSFTTSRFRNAAALARDVLTTKLRHRYLPRAVALTPGVMSDQALEAALLAAGDEARPAADRAGVTLYWPAAGPRVLLVDAAEPLWRDRSEPRLEVVPGQDDPAYMQVLPSRVTALEIVDASVTPVVDFFVRSPAGTRTFVVLRPIASAVTLRLELHRPASTLFAIAEETALLVELPIDAQPPWEV